MPTLTEYVQKTMYVFSEHILSCKIFEIIFCLAILAGTYSFTERWELRFDTTTTHANSEFYKLLRLPVSPILKIQIFPLGMLILRHFFLILYPSFENPTTCIAIMKVEGKTIYLNRNSKP